MSDPTGTESAFDEIRKTPAVRAAIDSYELSIVGLNNKVAELEEELAKWILSAAILQANRSINNQADGGWFLSPYVEWTAAERLVELGKWERHPEKATTYRMIFAATEPTDG